MKFIFTVAVLLTTLHSQAAEFDFVGRNQKKVNCIQLYNTYEAAKNVSYNYAKAANDCSLACSRSTAGFDDPTMAKNFEICSGAAKTPTGAAARCEAAAALLTSTAAQDRSVWQACTEDCNEAVDTATQATLKQRYSATSAGCGEKIQTVVEPPVPDDSDTVADQGDGDTGGSTDDLPVADTGSPNTPALNDALSGLSANSSSLTPIDAGRGVNFRGSGNSSGSYGDVANGVGALGPQSGDVLPPQRFDDVVGSAAHQGPKANAANFGGGSTGGGSGMGGGLSGGGARPGGAGGGGRTSIAGAQLAKQGNNQFWAGGSGGAPAGGKATARTTATALKVPLIEKPKFGPEYLNKGTGSDGLLRLWGAGMNRLPVNNGSQSCRDQTIFCNLENFDFEFKP